MNEEELLLHYGVKGMKWGIRRKRDGSSKSTRPKVKERTESLTAKTKYGDTVTLAGEPTPKFTKFLASRFKGVRENVEKSDHFQLKDPNGKRVGEMQLYQESKDSINVVWVGVDSSARGNGYAQAAMQAAVKHAKKKGLSKVTLEVPGTSPDAKHIYEKLGFKDTGVVDDDDGSMAIWGGLTHMELKLKG